MFDQILAPLDGSSLAECVLPHLISLAEAYDAEITLVQVLECPEATTYESVDPLHWAMCKAEAEAYLDQICDRLEEAGIREAKKVVLEGQPADRTVEFVQSNDVDLVVLSSHGKSGLSRWNVSSVVRKVVQRANCSTMIVRAYKTAEFESLEGFHYKRLLVPLDGSQRAECALSTAVTLTRLHEAQLILGHVIDRPEMPRQVRLTNEDYDLQERFVERNKELSHKYFDQLQARLSVEFEPLLRVNDDISATMHKIAEEEEVDLVVLCAHGHSGKTKWPFGSLTTSFIEYGTTPLLMIQDLGQEEVEPTEAELAAEETKGH
ncbi:MAG: universal stress protein [Chloroflexota bacterium]|jgi:nucleotide-binding universal stress UspA family protein